MNALIMSLLLVANVVYLDEPKNLDHPQRISEWQICALADSPGKKRMFPILLIYIDGSFDYVAPCKAA